MLTLEAVTPAHPKFVLLSARFDALVAHQQPKLYRTILSSSRVLPGSQCWLAKWQREVIGCAALTMQASRGAAVSTLYVTGRYAGRGIERQLLNMLEGEARKRRIQRIVLPSSSHWPAGGGSLEDMGYRPATALSRQLKREGLRSYIKQL